MSRQRISDGEETLPFELIWEVLTLLPALHVIGCKRVCRTWRAIIESPEFVKQHMRQMIINNNGGYTLDQESRRPDLIVYRNPPAQWGNEHWSLIRNLEKPFEVVGSCNGILCAIGVADSIFLWNPTTNHHRVLPPHNIQFPSKMCNRAVLCFGVGYVEATNEFKVVRIVLFTGTYSGPYLSIYSSTQNVWRDLGHFMNIECQPGAGVFVQGALHWIISFGPHGGQLAAFDLASERFRIIRTPIEASNSGFPHNIGSLGNETLIYYTSFYFYDNRICLWLLRNYGDDSSWTKITMDAPIFRNVGGLVNIQPIRFIRPGDSKILMRIDPIGTYAYWDIIENRLYEIDYDVVVHGYCTMHTYIESIEAP